MAMLSIYCGGLGRAGVDELFPVTDAAAMCVTLEKEEGGHSHSLAWGGVPEEESPLSFPG